MRSLCDSKNEIAMPNMSVAFLLLRLGVGLSFFGHGLVRLPKLHAFSQWMTDLFEPSLLPRFLVLPFSYILPVAEFIVGVLLLLGMFTRQSLVAGAAVMLFLVFGSCMVEEWSAIPSQLIHILFLAILLTQLTHNTYSVDQILKK